MAASGRSFAKLRPIGVSAYARVLVCLAVGGAAGFLAMTPRAVPMTPVAPTPEASLDGTPLPLEGDVAVTLDEARSIARRYVEGEITIAVPGGGSIRRTRAELGARIESNRLASLVLALRDPSSAIRRAHAQHHAAGVAQPLRLPLPVSIDDARALAMLLHLKDDLDKAPTDAKIDLTTRKILRDEPGRRVDVYATLARLDAALSKGDATVDAVVETVPARRPASMFGEIAIDDVLGFFETKYARDQKHEARTYNLRLAASKLDGQILLPGETFDFNEIVGPRTEANGYKVAPVIAQGELVDGIGGGTCQVAGTLHGAALFAGLDIVERKPHTRPSFYIKMGLDATVVHPTITLRFKNPFAHPIVLHETVKEGMVRAEILGPTRTRDVTFVRKINEVVPFKEREVEDPKIPKGERILGQRGIPGFRITRFRVVRDGAIAVREKTTDVYPSTTQIWRIGTGDPNALKGWSGHDDDHPEYVVDEYLVLCEGFAKALNGSRGPLNLASATDDDTHVD
jgi:vancomycin resistance protein YoaR